jgi:GntR family transcriptional regulator
MTGPFAPEPIDHQSWIPFYVQVKERLKEQIDSGALSPGSLLPSEAELCTLFGVSRIVIRRALQELEYEGRIYRRRGKGSFVAEPKVHEQLVQKLTGFYQDMLDQGHEVTNRVRRLELVAAGADVASALEVKNATAVVVCERLRLVDGKPVNFSESYVPYAVCPALLDADLRNQSLYAWIERACGQRIVRGRRTIEAILAPAHIAELLEIDAHLPVFKITSTCYLADGTPIEHSRGYHRSDRSLFEVVLLREPDPPAPEHSESANRTHELPQSHRLID